VQNRRVLVVPASFVADCLETTVEIGMEYRELFLEEGGDELVMVEALNSNDEWTKAVMALLLG
jgi:protoporphyrin/coproporphyrin ferrochelatase